MRLSGLPLAGRDSGESPPESKLPLVAPVLASGPVPLDATRARSARVDRRDRRLSPASPGAMFWPALSLHEPTSRERRHRPEQPARLRAADGPQGQEPSGSSHAHRPGNGHLQHVPRRNSGHSAETSSELLPPLLYAERV